MPTSFPADPATRGLPPTEELPRPLEAHLPPPEQAADKDFLEAIKGIPLVEVEAAIAEAVGRLLDKEVRAQISQVELDFTRGATLRVSLREPVAVDFTF